MIQKTYLKMKHFFIYNEQKLFTNNLKTKRKEIQMKEKSLENCYTSI